MGRDSEATPHTEDEGARQWRRITATVRPLHPRPAVPVKKTPALPAPAPSPAAQRATARRGGRIPPALAPSPAPPPPRPAVGSAPVDSGWEKRLRSGRLSPDRVIDLHGHHLASAHVALSRALDRAVGEGARVLLVIAGKARGADEAPRGAIRRELAAWLAHGPHARSILAVRNAHPRHGGAGALYIVLRRG